MMFLLSSRIFRLVLLLPIVWAWSLPLRAGEETLEDYAEILRSRELYNPLNWRSERARAQRILSETESRMIIADEMRNRPDRRSALDGSVISQATIRERGREMVRTLQAEADAAQRILNALSLVREAISDAIREEDFRTFRNRQGQTMEAVLFDFDSVSATVLNRNLRPSRFSHEILSEETLDLLFDGQIPPIVDRLPFVPDLGRAERRQRQIPEERWVRLPPDFRFITGTTPINRDELERDGDDPAGAFLVSLVGDPVTEPSGVDPLLGQAYFLAVARIAENGEDARLRQFFSSEGRYGYMVYRDQEQLKQLLFREGRVGAAWTTPAESPGFPGEPFDDAILGQPLPDTRPDPGFSLRLQSPFLEFYRGNDRRYSPTRVQLHHSFARALLQLAEVNTLVAGVREGLKRIEEEEQPQLLTVRWELTEGWTSTPEIVDETFLVAGFLSQLLLKELFPPTGLNLRVDATHFLWEVEGGRAIEWVFRDRRFELRLAPNVEDVQIP